MGANKHRNLVKWKVFLISENTVWGVLMVCQYRLISLRALANISATFQKLGAKFLVMHSSFLPVWSRMLYEMSSI